MITTSRVRNFLGPKNVTEGKGLSKSSIFTINIDIMLSYLLWNHFISIIIILNVMKMVNIYLYNKILTTNNNNKYHLFADY